MVVWEATECCQYHSCNVYFSFSCCHPHDYDDDHDDNDHHRLKNTTAECFDFHFSGHLGVGHFNTRFSSPLPTMSRFPKSGKITKHLTSEKFSLFTFTFVERRSRPFSHFHIFFNQNLPSHSCLFFKRTSGKIPHGVKNFSFRNLSFYFHLDFHF